MYDYTVQIQHVNRYHIPSNRTLDGHIENIQIGTLAQFSSPRDFHVGDVINIEGIFYVINKCIIGETVYASTDCLLANKIILRVSPYQEERVHTHGSDSWVETIPLM